MTGPIIRQTCLRNVTVQRAHIIIGSWSCVMNDAHVVVRRDLLAMKAIDSHFVLPKMYRLSTVKKHGHILAAL